MDRRPRRAPETGLYERRLQNGLRHRAGGRRQGASRTGGEEMRFPGVHSHVRQGAFPQRLRSRGSRSLRSSPAEAYSVVMKFFRVLPLFFVLGGFVLPGFAVEREAFTFTSYDLNVRVEPEQQRLGVRGKITL